MTKHLIFIYLSYPIKKHSEEHERKLIIGDRDFISHEDIVECRRIL